jgi:hypothetical protein
MSRVHSRMPERYDPRAIDEMIDAIQRQFREALLRSEHIVLGIDQNLYIRSSNGKYWKITVSDLGVVTTTDMGTTLPN